MKCTNYTLCVKWHTMCEITHCVQNYTWVPFAPYVEKLYTHAMTTSHWLISPIDDIDNCRLNQFVKFFTHIYVQCTSHHQTVDKNSPAFCGFYNPDFIIWFSLINNDYNREVYKMLLLKGHSFLHTSPMVIDYGEDYYGD